MKMSNASTGRLVKISLTAAIMLLVPLQSFARDVTLSWAANPEQVSGYKLYYKPGNDTTPPNQATEAGHGKTVVLGNVTTYTVKGLSPDETYRFVLTAYKNGEESPSSTVVTVPAGSTPKIVKIANR